MSRKWGDTPELAAIFQAEASEHLASLNSGLLALETNPGDRDTLDRIRRDAHSVKGSAKLLGFQAISDLAHEMEEILVVLAGGHRLVTADLCDVLLKSCDTLAGLVGRAASEHDDESHSVIALLRSALSAGPGATCGPDGTDGSAEAAVSPAAGPSPPARDEAAAAVVSLGPDLAGDEGALVDEPVVRILAATQRPPPSATSDASSVVRVDSGKVYDVIDAVGEAVIGQFGILERSVRLAGLARRLDGRTRRIVAANDFVRTELTDLLLEVREEVAVLAHDVGDLVDESKKRMEVLQERAMALAMVPASQLFGPLPRLVRDLCRKLGKEVDLVVDDGGCELDKQVLDRIAEPVRALLINAVDHGIEPPDVRTACGKSPVGSLKVTATQLGGQVQIEVADDGRGIDAASVRRKAVALGLVGENDPLEAPDLARLLFSTGFSTADRVTDVSGRGVGLDIVRTAIDGLKGAVEVDTERGRGTCFTLTLPTTLAIVEVLIVLGGGQRLALPVTAIDEVVGVGAGDVRWIAGRPAVELRDHVLPLTSLGELLGRAAAEAPVAGPVAIVSHAGRSVAIRIEGLAGQREIAVKSLGTFLPAVRHVSGASILGDGAIVLVLDPGSLVDAMRRAETRPVPPTRRRSDRRRVLVVDDSHPIREMERSILQAAGFDVETATDGEDALLALRRERFDAVVTDLEMPRIGGFELCSRIRSDFVELPVMIVTSRSSDDDRRRGLELGASAYMSKGEFDQGRLVETLKALVG